MNLRRSLLSWISVLVLASAWGVASVVGLLSASTAFPSVGAVIRVLFELPSQGYFGLHLIPSLERVAAGLVVGVIFGTICGLATGRSRFVEVLVAPPLHVYRALPPIAVVPFLIALFGVSDATRVLMIALGVFFPVWLSAHEGARGIDSRYMEVASDLGLSRTRTYWHVILPATVPYLTAGIRTAIGMAYIMLFISEWVGASSGIGYHLSVAHAVSRWAHMVVGLLVLGALAAGTDFAYRKGVKHLFPWLVK